MIADFLTRYNILELAGLARQIKSILCVFEEEIIFRDIHFSNVEVLKIKEGHPSSFDRIGSEKKRAAKMIGKNDLIRPAVFFSSRYFSSVRKFLQNIF